MESHLETRLRHIPPSAFHDLVAKIAEIEQFRGWVDGRAVSEAVTLRRLRRAVAHTSAAASLRIGGRDRPQPEPARGRQGRMEMQQHDAAHITGYAELLQAVFDGYRQMQFGPDLILEFHARVLKYSHSDQWHRGKYKTAPDSTRSYLRRKMEPLALRAADPDRTPLATAAASEWTRRALAAAEFHPLLIIAAFILEFLAIRPFAHGNGRVSRVLTNLLLLQCGYSYVQYASLEHVIAAHWPEYYVALRRSQANAHPPHPDITPWLSAFLETMQLQSRQLKALLGTQPDTSLLSANQLRVLRLLERNGEITNRLAREELGMPKDTAKQVFNRLVALNLVQRRGAGRAVSYRKALLQTDSGGSR